MAKNSGVQTGGPYGFLFFIFGRDRKQRALSEPWLGGVRPFGHLRTILLHELLVQMQVGVPWRCFGHGCLDDAKADVVPATKSGGDARSIG